ncbi:MAG: TonB-dependent receptor [Acidobacteria bacterium]|nr:TonB-dependent receptor [Acidobacteriota bacterium]
MTRQVVGLGAIVCAWFSAAWADVRLVGRVTDENNVPVPGAQVTLTAPGQPLRLQAVTDLSGRFGFRLPALGDYLLAAECENYFRLKEHQVRLVEDGEEVTLVLNPVREVFERIDVSHSAPLLDFDRTTQERRLSGTRLVDIPYPRTASLRNALRAVPGIVQDSRGGLHLNGATEEQVLYTLDGFQINDPLTGRFESRLSVESVRGVEVSTGNLSAEYGKGSAGALAVKTSAGDDTWRYSATNFLPGFEHRKELYIGGWTPRFNFSGPIRRGRAWFAYGTDVHYDQLIVEDLPKGENRTRTWRLNNLLRNQINLSPSHILYTGVLTNAWTAPRNGLSFLDPLETTVDRRNRQWFFDIKDQLYFGRGALLEAGFAVNRTFAREIPQGDGVFQLTPEGKRGNFFLDAVRKANRDQFLANLFLPTLGLGGSHQLKAGVDLAWTDYWQDTRRTAYENFRADGTRLRRVTFGGNGRFDRSNFEAASYLQDSWKPRPGLLVDLGVRQDWDRLVGNFVLAPRVGFAWAPPGMDSTKISGGWGRVYDQTPLRLFTRPLDQYSLTTYFDRSGVVVRGPAVSAFWMDRAPLKTPRYHNLNLGLEHRLANILYTRFAYFRRRGWQGFTYANMLPEEPPPTVLAAAFPGRVFDAVYRMGNRREDVFDSFEITFRQTFHKQYEWMASYTRSRAMSNAVVDVAVDDPILVSNNVGRMPWDAPHRLVSWGLLPFFWHNWAVAYLVETRNGFPFSVVDDDSRIQGQVNELRFPAFFELNLHLERRFFFRKHRWALRAGFNNITGRRNPNVVNNNLSSPNFMRYYGGQSRALNFRLRWLGRQ